MTSVAKSYLEGKHIVLGISGGIAAYKSAYLLRLLIKMGAEVQVVITPSGKEFITPVTLAALSGKPVVSEFFSANTGEWHSHVDLGLWADLMIIAPATASTIGKMANGIADNMLVTTYLSAKEQVMVAPAMDLDMWAHPSTQRNVATLRADGVIIVEPQSGFLASGLTGKGRMEEPEAIAAAANDYFRRLSECVPVEPTEDSEDLMGKRIVISAGPTYEDIDPVRFIGNYSSGKMGFALAEECSRRGADVTVVAGPVDRRLELSSQIQRIDVRSAKEMLAAMEREFEDADMAVMAAAVADYAPAEPSALKIKRENRDELTLRLVKNPDIARCLGEIKGERKLVGFALETDNALANAFGKLKRKNLDMIVLNSLSDPGAGMMTDTNKVTIIRPDAAPMEFPLKTKREVAADIADAISLLFRR
ncbi:MAG: bifunctional phosphopantothenoylcysteine decarboxylase/phosphopantothenate--cysteine ligase CoaBC [Muribaculaceae bacterium]|nr:bifunctional phosphopantothenoylcysteine decarboxylase/phosphopantothenate--cysteine ligase CoaBC [Muribaculaceae bacterium]